MSIRVLAPSAVVVLSLVWFGVASVSASFRNSSLRMLTDDGYVPVGLGLT